MIKPHVLILCGGQSAEHEVSLISARSICLNLPQDEFQLTLVGVSKNGCWHIQDIKKFAGQEDNPKTIAIDTTQRIVNIDKQHKKTFLTGIEAPIDVAFPIFHGINGEDGSIQGLLEFFDIPYVGSGIAGSAIGMDKDLSKRLLRDAGLPQAEFVTLRENEKHNIDIDMLIKLIGLPCFVKPANTGSSIGISKAKNKNQLQQAIKLAFQFDRKVIVEQAIAGRECEISLLGNDDILVAVPGEVVCKHEFYSYDAKYIDPEGAKLLIPAQLSESIIAEIQELAKQTYQILELSGLARIDFFVDKTDQVFVNEANTLPGLTKISLYPKLWAECGLDYPSLLTKLISLAFNQHQKKHSFLKQHVELEHDERQSVI